ncbi:hypothetical protein FRC09_017266 [Ceratobasidium sp. 395]|nr:hypothetical protein FRC09_017266 [Ceratobasidium sp. 395]
MSPPEQSNKSKDKFSSDISKSLISVEYKGRKAVIRRSAHYDVTISSVKKAFKDLRDVSNDNIVISAFLKEFDDTVEVPEESWPTVLPEIKKATVFATGLVQHPGQFKRKEKAAGEQSKPKPGPGPAFRLRDEPDFSRSLGRLLFSPPRGSEPQTRGFSSSSLGKAKPKGSSPRVNVDSSSESDVPII